MGKSKEVFSDMKRFLSLSLALLLSFALLAGCTNSGSADTPDGANGGIVGSDRDSANNDTTGRDTTATGDGDLLDRTENAVDDMVDDLDPNLENRNTENAGDSTTGNANSMTTDDTNPTTDNNTAR